MLLYCILEICWESRSLVLSYPTLHTDHIAGWIQMDHAGKCLLAWTQWSFWCVYLYQNIMLYTLNIFNFIKKNKTKRGYWVSSVTIILIYPISHLLKVRVMPSFYSLIWSKIPDVDYKTLKTEIIFYRA